LQVSKLLTVDKNGKNSTQAGFDWSDIVQYGFTFGMKAIQTTGFPTGRPASSCMDHAGAYTAVIPAGLESGLAMGLYRMWAPALYPRSLLSSSSSDWGSGNPFNTNKVGMMEKPILDFVLPGQPDQRRRQVPIGAMPSYNGRWAAGWRRHLPPSSRHGPSE